MATDFTISEKVHEAIERFTEICEKKPYRIHMNANTVDKLYKEAEQIVVMPRKGVPMFEGIQVEIDNNLADHDDNYAANKGVPCLIVSDKAFEEDAGKCCGICKYYAELRKNFTTGKGFEESHCCTALENYIVECKETDVCEMFAERPKIPKTPKITEWDGDKVWE